MLTFPSGIVLAQFWMRGQIKLAGQGRVVLQRIDCRTCGNRHEPISRWQAKNEISEVLKISVAGKLVPTLGRLSEREDRA